ncbi:winged helix-turn-helix transcriptional regulator [Luteibacter aegosomatissinici]|uniref:winged helix-turn-helix transcriptional regulator n=1 Tax=Luteibacter aegosomatissinici TaxID=2911539 RepID=UPI001FF8842A|nr:helix-turn-helix domain-containing protein [Luteibacter aegosomatissinici]UPG92759.1 helix-turn-helix transcriptional regulator [Luteibacter aegosomatissinici]
MDIDKLSTGTCAISRGLALVGDTWSALILRDAGRGMTQFDQFRVSLGIAPNILSRRLKSLTEAGVLERRRYSERPPRDEYVLTNAGVDFLPILAAIGEWGRTHNGDGVLGHIEDAHTGETVQAIVVDGRTGKRARPETWRVVMPMRQDDAGG